MKQRILGRVGILAFLILGAVAFPGRTASAAPKHLTIVYSVASLQFPFFIFQSHFIKQAAAKIGNVSVVVDDGQNSATKQTSDVEAAIARHVDGIIISPLTVSTLVPALKEAAAAHVPVVTIDRQAVGAPTLAHVGADNVAVGATAARFVANRLHGKGTVILLTGTPGSSAAVDRTTGIMQVLSKYPNLKIAYNQTAQFDRATAINVMEAAMSRLPKFDAVICENDDMALGVVQAMKGKGLFGKVLITGADAIPDALSSIAAGQETATVEQFGDKQAFSDMQILVAYLRNHVKPKQHTTLITPLLITKENLKQAVVKK